MTCRAPWSCARRAGCSPVAYILVADHLGFHLTALILLAAWMRILGASWRLTGIIALAATLVIHFAFYKGLRVPLPWGVLERWAF